MGQFGEGERSDTLSFPACSFPNPIHFDMSHALNFCFVVMWNLSNTRHAPRRVFLLFVLVRGATLFGVALGSPCRLFAGRAAGVAPGGLAGVSCCCS